MQNIFNLIFDKIYKAIDWIGAGISYSIYQFGIPLEVKTLVVDPTWGSVVHGIISALVPVFSYFLIHISTELLKDKTSWLSRITEKVVYAFSFKWLSK
jgi:hypothetical protein